MGIQTELERSIRRGIRKMKRVADQSRTDNHRHAQSTRADREDSRGTRRQNRTHSRQSWKMERASVSRSRSKSASNKYKANDRDKQSARGGRSRVWVGGYRRGGKRIAGYYRQTRTTRRTSARR